MSSPLPTILICATYVYLVKVAGPNFMTNRKPYNIKNFLIVYNALQVVFSLYIFVGILGSGWIHYSPFCQAVDYTDDGIPMAVMAYTYWLSKFTEFTDTFAFVARKKFRQVSTLHVIHHGIMPLSVWPGMRWVPGGHATFFGLL